ncbi:MAG: hypothetical protein LYZ66_03320 [Nitrososphaerales archaeon]|nr:hypothetical protein [Nitrososphaerales archaeon]
MVRGYCSRCNIAVGGFGRPPAWQCPTCWKLFCLDCCPGRVGRWFKKPVCPECKIELVEGGLAIRAASGK